MDARDLPSSAETTERQNTNRIQIIKEQLSAAQPISHECSIFDEGPEVFSPQPMMGPSFQDSFALVSQEVPPSQILRGPKRLPNSMHRILRNLNGKLNSKHYDTYWLQERVNRLHQPATDKFDRFFDAKMRFANKAVAKHSNFDHLQRRFTRNI